MGWISAGNQNNPDSTAKIANFNVESYAGETPLSIRGFDEVSITDSTVEFANSFDVEKLTVDTASTVALADGTSFGKLSVVFADEVFEEGETFEFSIGDVFTDTTIVLSALEDGSSFTVLDSEGNEWSAVYDGAGNILIGAMIPEASHYAFIFGIVAIIFAAQRKRSK